MWLKANEPDAIARTAHVLFVKDYVRFLLTGEAATDRIEAQGTLMWTMPGSNGTTETNGSWDAELVALSGLKMSALPKIVEPTALAGRVTAGAAAFTGLPAGTPVICGTSGWTFSPMDGIRLRRMLPSGLAFMAVWCIGWDAGAFYGLVPKFVDAMRAYSEKGFDAILVVGVVFPLIGVAMTVYFFRLLWKHLRPSYEVRLVGGLLKEGERATFEYRFKGDAEEVKSVAFATALYARPAGGRRGTVTLGEAPGAVNDSKKFTHPLEIASGSVTLEMPRIAKDCHTSFRYYFRATVVFKSGLSVASSYCIPLK